MSTPCIPPELLDIITDLLDGNLHALGNCCLVSKSWIPRARRHLFVDVRFYTPLCLQLWKEAFPDPSASPARYTKYLTVGCLQTLSAKDAEVGGWIRGFSRVVRLELLVVGNAKWTRESASSLFVFHRLSPTVKSLLLGFPIFPVAPIFDLILSFPLLEDLSTVADFKEPKDNSDGQDWLQTVTQPSSPPMTGSLELFYRGESQGSRTQSVRRFCTPYYWGRRTLRPSASDSCCRRSRRGRYCAELYGRC